jgi:ribonuclease D
MAASVLERYGKDLLEVVNQATRSAPETWPERRRSPRRPPPDPAFERRVERLRAVRDAVADSLGIDRGFLMPRQQLEDVARLQPADTESLRSVPDVRNWQVEALGSLIVDALG